MAEHQREREKIIDLEKQLNAKQAQLDLLLMQNDDLHQAFTEEIQNMESSAMDHSKRIFNEQEKLKFELETKMRDLEAHGQELMKRVTGNEVERRKLAEALEQNAAKICSLHAAAEEQRRADEKVMKLAEEQKREKEALLGKLNDLEKELEAKQALELEIVELRCKVNIVMKHIGEEGDLEMVKEVELLLKERKEKEDAMNSAALEYALEMQLSQT